MYAEIARNKRRTVALMFGFFVIIAALGYLVGSIISDNPPTFLFIFGFLSLAYALFSYFGGARMALAVNGAKEITKKDNPRLWRTVENLAITTGMPMPKVYVMDDPAPNAFATGRNPQHSAVAATTGLLETMNDTELEAVMAHEMGHVQNYDIRVNTLAFALVGIISMIADVFWNAMFWGGRDSDNRNQVTMILALVAVILAPIAATLLQLSISRRREYLADATGALTTRYPDGLASALEKIAAYGSALKRPNTSTAHMFFANPLKGKTLASLFSTHPPVEDRIAKLRGMKL